MDALAGEQLGALDRQRTQALEASQLVKYFLEFHEGRLSSVFTDPTKIHQVHTPTGRTEHARGH